MSNAHMGILTPQPDLEGQPLASPTHPRHSDVSYEQEHNDYTPRQVTRRQLFYILVPQGLGAAIIDATANFAIACAMYRTTRKEIRLWPLEKNTIAGDMGVTVIIQGVLTTLITSALVRGDIREKRIEPFHFAWPDAACWRKGKSRWKNHIGTALNFLSPVQTLSFRHDRREFAKSLCLILVRGFILSTLFFFIFWPLAIAIAAPLYGGIDMHETWTPEIIKGVFGGVLGLFMNPFVAALVLGAHATPHIPDPDSKSESGRSVRDPAAATSDRKPRRIASTTPISRITSPSSTPAVRIASTTPTVQVAPASPIARIASATPLAESPVIIKGDANVDPAPEMRQLPVASPFATPYPDSMSPTLEGELRRPATAYVPR